jgi:site-specific recombinase XerD
VICQVVYSRLVTEAVGPQVIPSFWVEPLTAWEEHARQAGFAVTTRRLRGRYLAAVARTVPDPWTATTPVLEAALAAAGLAPSSTFDARGALRAFYTWALAAGRVSVDPAREMTCAPRRPEAAPAARVEPGDVRTGPGSAPQLPPSWAAAVREWAVYVGASGGSPQTVRMRRHYLAHAAQIVGPDPWSATTAQLLRFVATEGWSPQTRKSARAALRAFYGWAAVMEHVTVDPSRRLPAVRVAPGVPRPAPDGVIAAARRQAGTARERLMIDLADLAGLRAMEVAGVHTDHVEGDRLRVFGKGNKERLVPLHPYLLEQLTGLPRGWVFPSRGRDGHITAAYVGKILGDLLADGWSGHTLRHACGTALYEATGDPFVVKEVLGHAKLDTSLGYTRVPGERLRAAVAARRVNPPDAGATTLAGR